MQFVYPEVIQLACGLIDRLFPYYTHRTNRMQWDAQQKTRIRSVGDHDNNIISSHNIALLILSSKNEQLPR